MITKMFYVLVIIFASHRHDFCAAFGFHSERLSNGRSRDVAHTMLLIEDIDVNLSS